jgi:uncharacterized membrane protein
VIGTIDAGRFGLDKVSNTQYKLYLDTLSCSLLMNGGATVIGAAIGSLFAPPFGTVIGAAFGILLSSAIAEWGVDISNSIVVNIQLQGAVIVFGVIIYQEIHL